MTSSAIPVAIVGATGYAGEGAVRILSQHDGFSIVHVGSDRLAGTDLGEAVPALAHCCPGLTLAADTPENILASGAQAVILAKKSPVVTKLVPELLAAKVKIVDIGAEFRLREHADYQTYYGEEHACPEVLKQAVYGLSELFEDDIKQAQLIGNPGCYPTSILIPLIPLLRENLIDLNHDIVSVSYSGVSGDGKQYLEKNNNLFYAMNENMHSYRALNHQHRGEIDQELSRAAGTKVNIRFVPHLAPITRGIHSTISCRLNAGKDLKSVFSTWEKQYKGQAFVRIRNESKEVEVANVNGTNFVDMSADYDDNTLIICSAEDNLVKGASGQAIQNINLAYNFRENLGLI